MVVEGGGGVREYERQAEEVPWAIQPSAPPSSSHVT